MPQYKLGRRYADTLDQVVANGDFGTPEAVLQHLVQTYAPGLMQRSQAVIIDPHVADNGARKIQDQWISYFNDAGRAMISAPNVYQAGKTASDELLASLRRDFYTTFFVSSTRIDYGDESSGRITHNHRSKVVKPSQRDVKVIPVYDGTPLSQALQSDEGIAYLHSLFDTNDKPQDITGTLENLSKRKADRIALWTPNLGSRNSYKERAVGFYVYDGRFHVDGVNRFGLDGGRSRGVSMSPRGVSKK